ncbi:MAG: hypothetical protein AAF502_23655 [Bacteroidota bacterium]
MTNSTTKTEPFIFREINSPEDLQVFLSLRNNMFNQMPSTAKAKGKIYNGPLTDEYDKISRHYGLFGPGGRPLGYVRFVPDQHHKSQEPSVNDVYSKYCTQGKTSPVSGDSFSNFIVDHYPDKKFIGDYLSGLKAKGKNYIHPSKLFLVPEGRRKGLAIPFMACLYAVAREKRVHKAIIRISAPLLNFYKKYGFNRVPGSKIFPTICHAENLIMEVNPLKIFGAFDMKVREAQAIYKDSKSIRIEKNEYRFTFRGVWNSNGHTFVRA